MAVPRLPTRELTQAEQEQLKSFHKKLLQSKTILAVVGAGLSASSGLVTFRGAGGLWRNYTAIDLATPDAFHIDPGLVWQFYSSRRYHALKARPNKGHFALAELSRRMSDKGKKFLMLTQNVDGLSLRAGHDPKTCLEIHGSLFTVKCTAFSCNYVETGNKEHPLCEALRGSEDEFIKPKKRSAETHEESPNKNKKAKLGEHATSTTSSTTSDKNSTSTTSSPDMQPVHAIDEEDLPHCPKCKSGLLRPGVVWFGESLPLSTLDTADQFLTNNKVDLCLVIGTSGTVWPAMGYVERVQEKNGGVVVFNSDKKDITKVNKDGGWGFEGDAAEWLPLALEPLIGSDFLPRNWKRK